MLVPCDLHIEHRVIKFLDLVSVNKCIYSRRDILLFSFEVISLDCNISYTFLKVVQNSSQRHTNEQHSIWQFSCFEVLSDLGSFFEGGFQCRESKKGAWNKVSFLW